MRVCREERDTDKSVDKCRLRYAVFKRHYPALVRLQKLMPFSVIDATGSVEECEAQIAHELRYQSSLDLDERTYASITTLPLAREVVQHSRKALVSRLDDYCLLHTDTYGQVRRRRHRLAFLACMLLLFSRGRWCERAPARGAGAGADPEARRAAAVQGGDERLPRVRVERASL